MTAKSEPLSAKEAAKELGTDARTLRKFLRSKNGLVGQGNRWAIERKQMKSLKKEFDEWSAKKTTGKKVTPVLDEEFTKDDDIDDIDALEELDESTSDEESDTEESEDEELEELEV